jgi:hypothetical protein
MATFDATWRFEAVADVHCHHHSFGKVAEIEDLYKPSIFGPSRNFRCECGTLVGEASVDRLCAKCGVIVSADSAATRRQRLGHIELASICHHPLNNDAMVFESFSVAPIVFRTESDGRTPNALGRKYEALLDVNNALRKSLPDRASTEFFETLRDHDTTDLQAALDDIVGIGAVRNGDRTLTGMAEDTLLGLLFREIATLGPDADHLARACGIGLRATALI